MNPQILPIQWSEDVVLFSKDNINLQKALLSQITFLNTNTRFLHSNIVLLSLLLQNSLSVSFPSSDDSSSSRVYVSGVELPQHFSSLLLQTPLRSIECNKHCYFTCSGTESNELALRMASSVTKSKIFLSFTGCFHGNSFSFFHGTSGSQLWPKSFIIHNFDISLLLTAIDSLGERERNKVQIEHVEKLINQMRKISSTLSFAGLIIQTASTSLGQEILPRTFIEEVVKFSQSKGIVVIVDEVEAGFGRLWTDLHQDNDTINTQSWHFWSHQLFNINPDIVTVGKCLGNGYSMGAVLCSPKVNREFNNGMEYFNTFGGNPVACLIGLTCLINSLNNKTQIQAQKVSHYLFSQLKKLKENSPNIIKKINGTGFFLGIEFHSIPLRTVFSRGNLSKDSRTLPQYFQDRLLDLGIQTQLVGQKMSVIKLTPSLQINENDCDYLIQTLNQIIKELNNRENIFKL